MPQQKNIFSQLFTDSRLQNPETLVMDRPNQSLNIEVAPAHVTDLDKQIQEVENLLVQLKEQKAIQQQNQAVSNDLQQQQKRESRSFFD